MCVRERDETSGTSRERRATRRERDARATADERDRRPLTRENGERARTRHTRVRRARACPNITDTHERERASPDASTRRLAKERERAGG